MRRHGVEQSSNSGRRPWTGVVLILGLLVVVVGLAVGCGAEKADQAEKDPWVGTWDGGYPHPIVIGKSGDGYTYGDSEDENAPTVPLTLAPDGTLKGDYGGGMVFSLEGDRLLLRYTSMSSAAPIEFHRE